MKGRLKAIDHTFEKVSVGATENILMAAALAEGVSILRNAALEPEIGDLGQLLQASPFFVFIETISLAGEGRPTGSAPSRPGCCREVDDEVRALRSTAYFVVNVRPSTEL